LKPIAANWNSAPERSKPKALTAPPKLNSAEYEPVCGHIGCAGDRVVPSEREVVVSRCGGVLEAVAVGIASADVRRNAAHGHREPQAGIEAGGQNEVAQKF
jgi:hypothetical protein